MVWLSKGGGGVGRFWTDRLECLSSVFFSFSLQCSCVLMFSNCSSHTSGKNEVKAECCVLSGDRASCRWVGGGLCMKSKGGKVCFWPLLVEFVSFKLIV